MQAISPLWPVIRWSSAEPGALQPQRRLCIPDRLGVNCLFDAAYAAGTACSSRASAPRGTAGCTARSCRPASAGARRRFQRLDLRQAVQVDHVAAVHAHEARRIQPRFDAAMVRAADSRGRARAGSRSWPRPAAIRCRWRRPGIPCRACAPGSAPAVRPAPPAGRRRARRAAAPRPAGAAAASGSRTMTRNADVRARSPSGTRRTTRAASRRNRSCRPARVGQLAQATITSTCTAKQATLAAVQRQVAAQVSKCSGKRRREGEHRRHQRQRHQGAAPLPDHRLPGRERAAIALRSTRR